jgi:SH3-like domain-containing protein
MVFMRIVRAAVMLAAVLIAAGASAQVSAIGPYTGLPMPRYVSLGAGEVNVRQGPGTTHRIAFRYVQSGLPVQIVSEFENWRRIRDWDGYEGWVLHSLLSSARSVLVAPWNWDGEPIDLRDDRAPDSATIAHLVPGVQGTALGCDGQSCRVTVQGRTGWIEQAVLWGVFADEVF